MDFYFAYKKHLEKEQILRGNLSLLGKYDALVELGVEYTLQEILLSHPYNWDDEDRITRAVWKEGEGRR